MKGENSNSFIKGIKGIYIIIFYSYRKEDYKMSVEIWVAIIAGVTSLLGSLVGCFAASKLQAYRIEQLEKKIDKIDIIENNQITIQGTLEGFVSTAVERRKVIENLQQEVEQLKFNMGQIQAKIAVLESQISMFHNHD